MQLPFHDHVVEHVAAIVDRRIGDDVAPRSPDRSRPRRYGSRSGRWAGYRSWPWCRGSRGCRRGASSRGAGRELEQRDAPVGADHAERARLVGDVAFGGLKHVAAMFLPFASIASSVATTAVPAVIAEREATEAKPGISRAQSPCGDRPAPAKCRAVRPPAAETPWRGPGRSTAR